MKRAFGVATCAVALACWTGASGANEPVPVEGVPPPPPPGSPVLSAPHGSGGFLETRTMPPERDAGRDAGPIGMSLSVGSGIVGFAGEGARAVTAPAGGTYDARLLLGTDLPIGFELAYVGSAHGLDALGAEDAVLVANGFEAGVRIPLARAGRLTPFLAGGAAWARYDVVGTVEATASLRPEDDVFVVPVGAGVALGDLGPGLVLDARATYRAAFGEQVIAGEATLDSVAVTARLGVEF